MFNDLSDKEKNPGVDDIFAETDKMPSPGEGPSIETKQAGLSSLGDKEIVSDDEATTNPDYDDEGQGSGKVLKIAIFVVIGAIVILGAYLIYTNFLAPGESVEVIEGQTETPAVLQDEKDNTVADVISDKNTNNDDGDFIIPLSEKENKDIDTEDLPNSDPIESDSRAIDSDGDGLNDYDEINIYNTNPNLIDSDFDGLSDYDEIMIYKTDPLKADTDGDGLNDYEEVKIYGTDPLKVDTDGDGYSDYEEVTHGYNPLGDGPLPGFSE